MAGTRTQDQRLKRPLLYRLSYQPNNLRHKYLQISICWQICNPILGNMTSSRPKPVPGTAAKPVPVNVAENLYRVQLPNDTPGKPTGFYYALLKRGGKQFRRSLKTKDRKLAERRLVDLRRQVGNLTLSPDSNLSFHQIANRWMTITSHVLKPRRSRLGGCRASTTPDDARVATQTGGRWGRSCRHCIRYRTSVLLAERLESTLLPSCVVCLSEVKRR